MGGEFRSGWPSGAAFEGLIADAEAVLAGDNTCALNAVLIAQPPMYLRARPN